MMGPCPLVLGVLAWLLQPVVGAGLIQALGHAHLMIMFPIEGTVVETPVHFKSLLTIPSAQQLRELEGGRTSLCVEVDGERVYCELLNTEDVGLNLIGLRLGMHAARLVLVPSDQPSGPGFAASDLVTFTAVERKEFNRQMEILYQSHRHEDLLTWAQQYQTKRNNSAPFEQQVVDAGGQSPTPFAAPSGASIASNKHEQQVLVVGVKTSVLDDFSYRQVIRQTWARKESLVPGVEILFIGCRPNATTTTDDQHRAIELEREHFGDLLTHELDCDDSYYELVRKIIKFMHFVTLGRAPALAPKYIMIADDDIYLRVNDLARSLYKHAPRNRYYAGQVWATQFGTPMMPVRDPGHKNYLTKEQYPMSELPPFANGPHYVLSLDCAQFIARNQKRLTGVGHLDDVSVALWMLTMQVHPEHSRALQNLRSGRCDSETLISFADLSTTGIRAIHDNLAAQRPFCHGFNRTLWSRHTIN